MSGFTVPRDQFRAVLATALPHVGHPDDYRPYLGRVRFAMSPSRWLVWAADEATQVVASAEVVDFLDGELGAFDLAADEVKAVLRVLRPPSGADARAMWERGEVEVRVTEKHVQFTEVGDLVPGRSVRLRLLPMDPQHEPRYPDVPRLVTDALGRVPVQGPVLVHPDLLARFVPAAQAWDGVTRLEAVADPDLLVVRIGARVVGTVPTYSPSEADRATADHQAAVWTEELVPLRRPESDEDDGALPAAVLAAAAEAGIEVELRRYDDGPRS